MAKHHTGVNFDGEESKSGSSWVMKWIGIAIAGVLLIVILLVAGIIFIRRREKLSSTRPSLSEQ